MATPIQPSRVPIRPMPKVNFPGRFRLCDEKRCIGQKCTFAHSIPELDAWNAQKGKRVKEGALPELLLLLSPVVHSWGLFARQIGVPTVQISRIQAANPLTNPISRLIQVLEWWIVNHDNPTYELIISALDPKLGETTPVMNRALASEVKKFMAKEQEKQFRFKKKIYPHPCPKVQIPFETDNSPDSFPPLTPQKVVPSQSLTSPPTPSYVQVVKGKHPAPGTSFKDPQGGTESIHVPSPLKPSVAARTCPDDGEFIFTPFTEQGKRNTHEVPYIKISKGEHPKSHTPDTQLFSGFPLQLKHTPVETQWPELEAHFQPFTSKPITELDERPHYHATPTSYYYSAMGTTFRERLAEPLQIKDIKQKLERNNYQEKFHKLLCWEEKEHIDVLQERCHGPYTLVVHQAGLRPRNIVDVKPYHKRFGYLCVLNDDKVTCATQASEGVVIIHKGHEIRADILKDNFSHTEQRLYIAFDKKNVGMLETCLSLPRSHYEKELNVEFELKHSYFNNLHKAVNQLTSEVIARLIPKRCDFVKVDIQLGTISKQYTKVLKLSGCSHDQWWALQMMLSCPANGPPVLISGPFGTGKTRILAIAVHSFFEQRKNTVQPVRILVCTQQHTSADTFLDFYNKIDENRSNVHIFRLVNDHSYRNAPRVETVANLAKKIRWNPDLKQSRLLIVTTCLTSLHLTKIFPPGFFTHILLDEGALMREPEGIAPLTMAGSNTKVVIAGDENQVGPVTLVLGKEAQENGLAVSLLERLQRLYKAIGGAANDYHVTLFTNYRCDPKILTITEVYYELPLKRDKPYHSDRPFPLLFVCSSIESEQKCDANSEKEVEITLEEVDKLSKHWPTGWDETKVCFLSPKRSQVTTFRNLTKTHYYKHLKGVQSLPTYIIQGREFQAVFLSTSESLSIKGEPFDPTKSLCNPYVFNTAVSRAKSFVVSVGNPFTLLRVERYMTQKFGEKGKCWSRYLKTCLENSAISFHPSLRISKTEEKRCLHQLKMKLVKNQLVGSFDTTATATAHSKHHYNQPLPVGLKTLPVGMTGTANDVWRDGSMITSPDSSVSGPFALKSESGDSGMQSLSTSESGSVVNLSSFAEPAETYPSIHKTPQSQARMLLANLEKIKKMLIATTGLDSKQIEKLRKEVDIAILIRDELEIGLTSEQKALQDRIHLNAIHESQSERIKEAKEHLDDEVEMFQSRLQDANDEIEELKRTNDFLRIDLKSQSERIKEIKEFQSQLQDANDKIEELKRINSLLTTELSEASQTTQNDHEWIKVTKELQSQLQVANDEIQELKKTNSLLTTDLEASKDHCAIQNTAITDLSMWITLLQTENTALHHERQKINFEQKRIEQDKVLQEIRMQQLIALKDKKREQEIALEDKWREQEKALEEKKREQEIALEDKWREQEKALEEKKREQEIALEDKWREQEKALEEKKREQDVALAEKWRDQEKALEEKRREQVALAEKWREQEKAWEEIKREQERRKQEKTLNEIWMQMKVEAQDSEQSDSIRETFQVVQEANTQLGQEEKIQTCKDGATPNKTSVALQSESLESQSDKSDDESADEFETTDSYYSDEETSGRSPKTESGLLPLADAFDFVQSRPDSIEEIDFLPLALSLYNEKVIDFTEIDTFIQPRTVYTAQQKFQVLICHIHDRKPQEAAETLWKIMDKNHLQTLISEIERHDHPIDYEEKFKKFLNQPSVSPENVQDENESTSSPPTGTHHGFPKSLPEGSCATNITRIQKPSELPYDEYLAVFDTLFQNGFTVENTVANAIMSSGGNAVEGVDLGTKLMMVPGSENKNELRPCIKVLVNIKVVDTMKSAIGKEIIQAVNSKYGKHFSDDDYMEWLEWLDFFEIPTGPAKPLGKNKKIHPGIQFDSQATSQHMYPDRSGTLGIMIQSRITVQGDHNYRHYGLSCAHCILSTAACDEIQQHDQEEDFEQWNRVQLHQSQQEYSSVPQGNSAPRLDIAQCKCSDQCRCSANEFKSLSLASLYPAKFAPKIQQLMKYNFKKDKLGRYAGLSYGWFPPTQALFYPKHLHPNEKHSDEAALKHLEKENNPFQSRQEVSQTDTQLKSTATPELTPKRDSTSKDLFADPICIQQKGSDAEQSSDEASLEKEKNSPIQLSPIGRKIPQNISQEQLAGPPPNHDFTSSDLISDPIPIQQNGSNAEQSSDETSLKHLEKEKNNPIQSSRKVSQNDPQQKSTATPDELRPKHGFTSADPISDPIPIQQSASNAEQSSDEASPKHLKNNPIQFNPIERKIPKTDSQEQSAGPPDLTPLPNFHSADLIASILQNGSNADQNSDEKSLIRNQRERNDLPHQQTSCSQSDSEHDSYLEQDAIQESCPIVRSSNASPDTDGHILQQHSTLPFPFLCIPFYPRAHKWNDRGKTFSSRCNIDAGAVSLTQQPKTCALQMRVELSDMKWKTARKFTDVLPSAPTSESTLSVYRYAISCHSTQQASGSLCISKPDFLKFKRAKLETAHMFSFHQTEECFIKEGDSGSVVYTLDRETNTATVFGVVYAMDTPEPSKSKDTADACSSVTQICHAFSLTNALDLLRPQLNYSSAKRLLKAKSLQSDFDKKSKLEKYLRSFKNGENLKKAAIQKLNSHDGSTSDEERRITHECVWKYLTESYFRQCNYSQLEGWIPGLEFKLEPCVSGCGVP